MEKRRGIQSEDVSYAVCWAAHPPGGKPGTGLADEALRFRKELLDKLAVFETAIRSSRCMIYA
jgi:hypothetical protein